MLDLNFSDKRIQNFAYKSHAFLIAIFRLFHLQDFAQGDEKDG